MGMFAEVICIGPYSKEIAEHLGYSKEQYIGTNEGAVVNQTLFGIAEGNELSRQFATILGITDPWDFNQHKISPTDINFIALKTFGQQYPDYEKDVFALQALSESGFELHFSPNG